MYLRLFVLNRRFISLVFSHTLTALPLIWALKNETNIKFYLAFSRSVAILFCVVVVAAAEKGLHILISHSEPLSSAGTIELLRTHTHKQLSQPTSHIVTCFSITIIIIIIDIYAHFVYNTTHGDACSSHIYGSLSRAHSPDIHTIIVTVSVYELQSAARNRLVLQQDFLLPNRCIHVAFCSLGKKYFMIRT